MNEIAYINNNINKILVIDDSELLHRMYDLVFMRSGNKGVEIIHAFIGKMFNGTTQAQQGGMEYSS